MKLPDFLYENTYWQKGYSVIGIDEVGRGAFAGPLFVGAVCFDYSNTSLLSYLQTLGINDSKKLVYKKRKELSLLIKSHAFSYGTSYVSTHSINRYGIIKSTHQAIRDVVKKIHVTDKFLLLDAFNIKYIRGIGLEKQKAIIHGDAISISIAAASIIAKVERDEYMEELSKKFIPYHWDQNKGYGTKEHISALLKYGKTRFHRELYIRNCLSPVV